VIIKAKYKDIIAPNAKILADNYRLQMEKETGKKLKVKKLVLYSDEMRIEFKEEREPDGKDA